MSLADYIAAFAAFMVLLASIGLFATRKGRIGSSP
jgi:hypothetical protein